MKWPVRVSNGSETVQGYSDDDEEWLSLVNTRDSLIVSDTSKPLVEDLSLMLSKSDTPGLNCIRIGNIL